MRTCYDIGSAISGLVCPSPSAYPSGARRGSFRSPPSGGPGHGRAPCCTRLPRPCSAEHALIGVRIAHPGIGQYHRMQPLWMGLFISLEWMCNGDRCGRGSESVHPTFRVMIQSIMINILQLNIIDDCSRNPINQSVVDDRARHLESKQDSDESNAVDTVTIRSKYHR